MNVLFSDALARALILAAALLVSDAGAQPPPVPPVFPAMEGSTIDGKPFGLASLRGKVVLVMFWSTGCAVCRDKMPELRQNYEGWAGKPFELVLVSVDSRVQDLNDYERIISRMVPVRQRFIQLWSGAPGYSDSFGKRSQLPASFLLDKAGKVVEQYQGRIPAETWDRIADLL